MTIEQLKKELHNVIERYANKTEFFGEVRRDSMATDCLCAIEALEAENAQLKEQVTIAKDIVDAANEHLESYKNKLAARTTPKAVSDTIVELREENVRLNAELKEKHKTEVKELLCLIRDKEKRFNRAFESEEKEIHRQKYKRCLAMAEWCDAEADVADADGDYEDMRWYQKWHDCWLEIADKFKEEK